MPFQPMNFATIAPQGNPLARGLLPAIQQGMQTAYSPRMMEADIFSKQFSPLAQIASSPLTLAMLPDQRTQMAELISRLLDQNKGAMTRGGGMQGGGGLLGNLFGGTNAPSGVPIFSGASANTQDNQYGPSNAPNVLPQAGGGLQGGALAQATGSMSQSPYKAGTVTQNPKTGEIFSTPAESNVAKAQQNQAAIKQLTPIINELANNADPFLSEGSNLKLLGSQTAGELYKWGVPQKYTQDIFGTPELAGKHAKFVSNQYKSIEKLMTIYNLPMDMASINRVEQITTPQIGETTDQYKSRMQSELQTLSSLYKQNQQIMGGGFELNNQPQIPQQGSFNQNVNNAVATNLQGNQPAQAQPIAQSQVANMGKIPSNWVVMRDTSGNLQAVHPEDIREAEKMGWSKNASKNVKGYS